MHSGANTPNRTWLYNGRLMRSHAYVRLQPSTTVYNRVDVTMVGVLGIMKVGEVQHTAVRRVDL